MNLINITILIGTIGILACVIYIFNLIPMYYSDLNFIIPYLIYIICFGFYIKNKLKVNEKSERIQNDSENKSKDTTKNLMFLGVTACLLIYLIYYIIDINNKIKEITHLFYTMFFNFFRYKYFPPESNQIELFNDNLKELVVAYTKDIISTSRLTLDQVKSELKNCINNSKMSYLYKKYKFFDKQMYSMLWIITSICRNYNVPFTNDLFNNIYNCIKVRFPGVNIVP
jgi:hypothetical protein